MRREVVFLVALLTATTVAAGPALATVSSPGQASPPGGILISLNPSHCYTPRARIRITVTSLTPRTSVQASIRGMVAVTANASSAGTATLTLTAPARLPAGRNIEAHLITVEGNDLTGETTSETAAFLLARRSICKKLRVSKT